MHISWLGTTAVKIQTKPNDTDITVVIDPYKPTTGTFPRNLAPVVGVYTRGEEGSITLSGNPFFLATPGECETHGVLMTAIYADEGDHLMVRLDSEGISMAHLGLSSKQPTTDQLDVIGGVDVLFLPVGHPEAFSPEDAVKAVNAIEARIVIPIAFKSDTDPKAQPVDAFLKEIGAAAQTPEKKIILKKKDLPQDETKVIVLSKE